MGEQLTFQFSVPWSLQIKLISSLFRLHLSPWGLHFGLCVQGNCYTSAVVHFDNASLRPQPPILASRLSLLFGHIENTAPQTLHFLPLVPVFCLIACIYWAWVVQVQRARSEDGLRNRCLAGLKIASHNVAFPQNGCFACVLLFPLYYRTPNRPVHTVLLQRCSDISTCQD